MYQGKYLSALQFGNGSRGYKSSEIPKLVSSTAVSKTWPPLLQQSHGFKTWQMRKDNRKRQTVKEYGPLRLRINGLRKNEILPKELQEIADKEIADLPINSCRNRIVNRCILTGRSRGNLRRFKICRMQWRLLADYNKLSGITRSTW